MSKDLPFFIPENVHLWKLAPPAECMYFVRYFAMKAIFHGSESLSLATKLRRSLNISNQGKR